VARKNNNQSNNNNSNDDEQKVNPNETTQVHNVCVVAGVLVEDENIDNAIEKFEEEILNQI
jgi:hypothetical protein